MSRQPIVETASGKVLGAARDAVLAFKGIPYAADTAGAHRFQPPRPVSWPGVRSALSLGPRSPQIDSPSEAAHLQWLRDPTACGEDCLVLNVFTTSLDATQRRPVMVYLHGGGFEMGSGGAPGVDGSNLARREVVVVTVNHRLNVFGHLHLGDADGGRYADAGNVGMLDCIAALEWVQRSIERFSGDPGNVTIFGQSGGGSKVAVLMAMPRARGLFHRAVIQSASSLLALATRADAERNTHHFLAQLGLNTSRLRALHELPVDALLRAMAATVKATGEQNFRPLVDAHSVPCQPFEPAAVQLSSHVPLLIGWCENEQRWAFAADPAVYRQNAAQARAQVAHALGVAPERADRLIDVYRRGRPHDTPGDLYAQIFGDHRYRRNVTQAAQLQAAAEAAPVYMYLLQWKSPALEGLLRTPHTLCIAFAFANVDLATGIAGSGADRYPMQEAMAGAWTAFARNGRPDVPQLPAWRPYSAHERPTLVFDRRSVLVDDPWRDERLALEPFPPYAPAIGEGQRTW